MKRIFWITLWVIILICINWVTDGFAQTESAQLKAFKKQYREQFENQTSPNAQYATPPIFAEDSLNADLPAADQRSRRDSLSENSWKESLESDYAPDSTTAQQQLILPDNALVERFGANLFINPNVGEINLSLVPEDYMLGPGDNILISLWGRVEQEWNLTVDRHGNVFIPKVGEITAWGMTLPEFSRRLDTQLKTVYSGYEKRVTLGKIRTIKVFVYGEVAAPGGYPLSALGTLFTALYKAGGPTDNGSFRSIKLIRNRETTIVDLYDFLINGDKTCDLPLQAGDVIFVPLVGDQAAIRGEVKRPAIYELTGTETVSDLIDLAGGPTASAYLSRLMLDRIGQNDSRMILDVDLTTTTDQNLPLFDGDDLSVFSIYQMRHNLVWITGMVKHPGTFERHDEMHLSDLIDKGQLLPNKVYRKRADLYRHHEDGRIELIAVNLEPLFDSEPSGDMLLEDLDSLVIYSTDQVERVKHVFVDGMVQKPGQYQLYDSMTAADLIFMAGNLQTSAYLLTAELARIDTEGNTNIISLNLENNLGTEIILQENDHLFIRKIPGYQRHRVVTINGEVRFPGKYSLTHNDETLWDLINRAGGFTRKAFPIGSVFRRRAIVDDLQRKNISNIVESSLPLLADTSGVLKPIDVGSVDQDEMDRIIVDMERLIASGGTEGDFKLQTGDEIYVPEIPTGISVLGEVCSNGTINFQPDKNVRFYLSQAGGYTKRADKSEVRLVRANGRVYADGGVTSQKVELGDVIVVPAKIKKEKDLLKFLATTASIITGLATTALIIDRL